MRIIGIDPGIATTGYGIIDSDGNKSSMLTFGCVKTSPELLAPERLEKVYNELTEILLSYKPDVMAVEKLFFARNSNSAMQVNLNNSIKSARTDKCII